MSAAQGNPTQTARRTKYGLNVTIAIVAATAIVIALNFIVDRGFRRLSDQAPGTTGWVRYDLTATRRYSLSPQTLKVMAGLEGDYEIVTIFRDTNIHVQRVRDLVEEYGRTTSKIDVKQLDPILEPAAADQFYQSLSSRYDDSLKPLAAAIDGGTAALRAVAENITNINKTIMEVADDPALTNEASKRTVGQIFAAFQRLEADIGSVNGEFLGQLEKPLPGYQTIRDDIASYLSQIEEKLLGAAIEGFEHIGKVADTPNSVKDKLLQLAEPMKVVRQQARDALSAVQFAEPVEAYEQARTTLLTQESIAILSPDQVRVVPIQEMFAELPPDQAGQVGERELGFIGEERLTGVLVSMLKQQPMVVFIQTTQAPALGPRAEYEFVAQRLRSSSFRVEQWNPTAQTSNFGQQMPPGPPPEAEEGQTAVWIVLPFPPPNPSNPMSFMANSAKKQVADHLKDRLAAGDGAMMIFTVELGFGFGEANPLLEGLKDWGITPQLDRLVMRQEQLPDRSKINTIQFDVSTWPDASPITAALTGMPAMFIQTSPITVDNEKEGVDHHELVVLRGPNIWANKDLASPQTIQKAPIDEAERRDSFVVGVAAERDKQRLIVVTDPMWASNRITNYGSLGPGTAELLGARYPGNSELFVNSVYWLTHLDELIAASPRSQDIRRIAPMSAGELNGWRWALLAGLPAVILCVGMGVCLTRRKG